MIGYTDRWSGRPGDKLTFYVSCSEPEFDARLVRLIHGDENPAGPGPKEELVASSLDGTYRGQVQSIPTGSFVLVDHLPPLPSLTFTCWIWPTLTGSGQTQCIFSRWNGTDRVGCALLLTEEDRLAFCIGQKGRAPHVFSLPGRIRERHWMYVAVAVDSGKTVHIQSRECEFSPLRETAFEITEACDFSCEDAADRPLLLGGMGIEKAGTTFHAGGCFNGKLDTPLLFDHALTTSEIGDLAARGGASPVAAKALARWSFVKQAHSTVVPDTSSHGYDGVTVNRPARLVTGHNFNGATVDPHEAPEQFNAVHFHEDDLADAGWRPAFEFTIPSGLRSGVYAAKLSAGPHTDHVPFVVRPEPGKVDAPVAVLLPTVSYMAYSNGHLDPSLLPQDLVPLRKASMDNEALRYVLRHHLHSFYDRHSDGSGVCMVSMLRPMPICVRPGTRGAFNNSPHQLAADLCLIDWLETKGIAYDVVTDHDLDREGAQALRPYRVVLSGSHPEYWTGKMFDGLEDYKEAGGRFIYLGGNGLYWVTALSEDQTIAEIRRMHGTRSWTAEPGEGHISLTGELGGLWRHRGRAPQKLVGVGFAAQGFDKGRPYRRLPASRDPRAKFIFEGVEDDLVGDFPSLISAYGGAGYEVDRADPALGTPAHALVVASASGFSESYQNAVEEAPAMTPLYGGPHCTQVRADMTFFETPNDGAIFSTGSISWCGALSYNNYDNNVSRITENVVRTFARPGPLPVADK